MTEALKFVDCTKSTDDHEQIGHYEKITAIPTNILNTRTIQFDVTSYAGYVKVESTSKKYTSNMFYWFFESQNSNFVSNRKDIPLLIWLAGGPGTSSLYSLLRENGPVRMEVGDDDLGTIVTNPDNWNKEVHLLYWDQPVGVGYSYSEPIGRYVESEAELSEQFYRALQGFYEQHPQYRDCPLYIAGESYAGKYNLSIAAEIVRQNEEGKKTYINLQGVAIGNGWINPEEQTWTQINSAFALGIIDIRQKEIIETTYQKFAETLTTAATTHDNDKMIEACELGDQVTNDISECGGDRNLLNIQYASMRDSFLKENLTAYFNETKLRTILKMVPAEIKWTLYNVDVRSHLKQEIMKDATGLLAQLLDKPEGYRVLIYTGDFDVVCGFEGIEKTLYNLNWKHKTNWQQLCRKVWVEPPQKTLAYIKSYENLTQVAIPGGGHLVAISKPKINQRMIHDWIFDRGFTTCTPSLIG